MVELIVVTHGTLSKALLETAQLLLGEQEHVTTFGLCLGDSVDYLREQVAQAIEEAQKEREVLVVTDMLAGSPFNVACSLLSRFDFEHVTGVNFPTFIELLSNRDECTAHELVEMAVSTGRETVLDAKKYFEEV